ncbi:MAG: hypothetical protein ABL925_15015 [Methylococcales bacterium]
MALPTGKPKNSHTALISSNKSGCLSNHLEQFYQANNGLVLPFSYRENAFIPPPITAIA